MSVFVTILIFLAIIVVVILVHELGHFITAKLSGVKVEELGIGFPPRLLSFKRGETVYSLNLIPLGGFCRMAGEEDPDVPGSLASKSRWTRLLVLSAGSIMMLLLPLLLFPFAYTIPIERSREGPIGVELVLVQEGVQVVSVAEGSPAEDAGIEIGDIILSVDGQEVKTLDEIREAIDSKLGTEVTLLLLRDSTDVKVTLTPRTNPPVENRAYPPWEAIPKGLGEYWRTLVLMKDAIVELVQGPEMPPGWEGPPIAGPIGIAQLTGEVAKGGAYPLIWFTCFLSVNLAIINLLPIPALDGGRVAFLFLEVIRRGKRISPQTEGLINTIGFSLLMLLVVVVSYYDVLRIAHGGNILP